MIRVAIRMSGDNGDHSSDILEDHFPSHEEEGYMASKASKPEGKSSKPAAKKAAAPAKAAASVKKSTATKADRKSVV